MNSRTPFRDKQKPQKVKSHCVFFADDAKLFKELKQLKDFEEIQDDLYELCVWASKWLLFFNIQKCKVIPLAAEHQKIKISSTYIYITWSSTECAHQLVLCCLLSLSDFSWTCHLAVL